MRACAGARTHAYESSLSTHPGPAAGEACAFMASLIQALLVRPEADTISPSAFLDAFDVVVVDPTGCYNLLGDMSRGTYHTLRREAQLAVEWLDDWEWRATALFVKPGSTRSLVATLSDADADAAWPPTDDENLSSCACCTPDEQAGAGAGGADDVWVGCDACDAWFHAPCVFVPDSPQTTHCLKNKIEDEPHSTIYRIQLYSCTKVVRTTYTCTHRIRIHTADPYL